jgi:hypothetical protein
MGRPRKHNKHLPANMMHRHKAYYFVKSGVWHPLGKSYGPALVQYAALVGAEPVVRTVKDAVWGYIEHKSDKLAPMTLIMYRRSAAKLCKVFGHVALEDIEPAMVYRYISEAGTVQANRDKALLSAAFTHARNMGAFKGEDPTKGIQYRNEEVPRDRYVTDLELATLVAKSSPKLSVIARFIALTGLAAGRCAADQDGGHGRRGYPRHYAQDRQAAW